MANADTYVQSPFNKSRDDKFIMVLDIPKVLKSKVTEYQRSKQTIITDALQFSVYGSIVPSIEVPADNVRYAGQTRTQSTHARTPYEPNTVKFTIDNRFNNYWVIYTWLNLLNNDKTGIYDSENLTSPVHNNSDYKTTISVFGLDEYNKRVVEFVYIDAFPTALGGIDYNYRGGNEIESSFTYSYSQLLIQPVNLEIESL